MIKAWREIVTIPTYEVGKPEKAPMFLEKRVYQGSSGVVYPYPVIESMSDEKVDKDYLAIWLENDYIKVMILPESITTTSSSLHWWVYWVRGSQEALSSTGLSITVLPPTCPLTRASRRTATAQ